VLAGRVEITVLDEADQMADMGFLPEVTKLLEQTPAYGPASALLGHFGQ
jgi:superfamily II DNA/RNA helicase